MASRLIVEMIESGDLVREGGHYIVANGSELAVSVLEAFTQGVS
jgi:hypothetical protein